MKNIALLSPNKNQFSETFIQKHKMHIEGNLFYFFGGVVPGWVEFRDLNAKTKKIIKDEIKIQYFLLKKFKKRNLSLQEYALKKAFVKYKIDTVYAEYGTTANACLNVCKELNLALVVNFHGYDITVREVLKNNNYYKELLDYATSVVVVSKAMKQAVLKLGYDESKIYYTPCSADNSFFNINPTFNTMQFVAIGRFVDKKAPYYTILAFKDALLQKPDLELILIGNGKLKNTCVNLVKFLKIEESVNFKGVCTPDEIASILENSLALVQHSIIAENGDTEGTPVAIMEAGASALPVISTKHAGIPDVVIDNETGILVDEHDVEAMTNAMIKLASNVELARHMGVNARQLMKSKYTLSSHMEIINKAINN